MERRRASKGIDQGGSVAVDGPLSGDMVIIHDGLSSARKQSADSQENA